MALRRDGIHDTRVLGAIERVPREIFVSPSYRHLVYQNQSLPLAGGQTLSQPYVVAKMTQELAVTADSCVLEIGTGSGYQTAVLARLCQRVTSVERIAELHHGARARLLGLEVYNADLHLADGFAGWPLGAPFDAIILTCAPETVSQKLLAQLAVGGRLIAPVGAQDNQQTLKIYTRTAENRVTAKILGVTRFVPMVSGIAVS